MSELLSQDSEVASLKEKYGRECRIMKNVGDFAYVVDVRPANLDIAIKFQLPGKILYSFSQTSCKDILTPKLAVKILLYLIRN